MTPVRRAIQRAEACLLFAFLIALPTPAANGAALVLSWLGFTGPVTF